MYVDICNRVDPMEQYRKDCRVAERRAIVTVSHDEKIVQLGCYVSIASGSCSVPGMEVIGDCIGTPFAPLKGRIALLRSPSL